MKFYLNGELTPLTNSLTISTLCKNLEINLDGTVILLNDDILQKNQYYFPIKENDKVEILRFVSGG
ncbi:thiamine biosynthesis protein ThiS [Cetobacterium ceti]|uniref:Thiamine biosynthesis protein ThiS n=1 Tax=Cetobacterium ceti TaxID=180163 RepID=A0A1T4MA24_9FUSO|nr:sulfur carrier protein ThiS [Cetobacterium ceti]SJZ63706.1 thiamine biosynthesis protein ThiS [Cetobacterium ceti]